MQNQRLFEIVYILLQKKQVTAKELAERFEVSTRTIYRDLDTLTMANIPIYTNKGSGGGIFLMENYTLSNALLSDEEQQQVLSALQSYTLTKQKELTPLLTKLTAQFQKQQTQWIDVDMRDWGGTVDEDIFLILKDAILKAVNVTFTYYNSYGQISQRNIEPFRLLFKSQNWYLIAYCLDKQDQRMFKLSRIKNIAQTNIANTHSIDEQKIKEGMQYTKEEMVKIKAYIAPSYAFRIYDEYLPECYDKQSDGSLLLHMRFPPGDWVYDYLMGFGESLQVLEPKAIRDELHQRFKRCLANYE